MRPISTADPGGESPRPGREADFDQRLGRLLQATGAQSASDLARILDISHQSVSAARKRRSFPYAWVAEISDRFGISADWLLYGAGPMLRSAQTAAPGATPASAVPAPSLREPLSGGFSPPRVFQAGELIHVPRVEARLHPGGGLLEPSTQAPALAFQHHFLSRLGSLPHLVVMDMPGDQLAPAIARGDCLLLDTARTEPEPGAIHVLAVDASVTVRRVERLPGALRLVADNPAHPPLDLPFPSPQVRILARVIWVGKLL